MATVVLNQAFDMSGSDIVKYTGGDVDSTTTASEHLSHGKYTAVVSGEQNFYGTPSGMIDSIGGAHKQATVFQISDLDITNAGFENARHDASSILGLLFGGNDNITGSSYGDVLAGQDGRDVLRGGGGDDILIGGRGADHLTGGVGGDTFKFEQSSDSTATDRDLITDYGSPDNVDLTAFGLGSTDGIRTTYNEAKDRTIVHVDANHDHHADLVFALNGDHQSDINFVI